MNDPISYPLTIPTARWRAEDNQLSLVLGQRWITFGREFDPLELDAFLRLLDGRTTIAIIASKVSASVEAVRALVDELVARDIVVELAEEFAGPDADAAAYLNMRQHIPLEHAKDQIAKAKIHIVGSGLLRLEVKRLLNAIGVQEVALRSFGSFAASDAFILAAPSLEELESMNSLNVRLLEIGQPWMQVLPHDGYATAIGPLFVPYQTSCFECYAKRRASNSLGNFPLFSFESAKIRDVLGDALNASLAAMLVADWIGAQAPCVPGRVSYITYGPEGPTVTTTLVRRVPRCSACSFVNTESPLREWSFR